MKKIIALLLVLVMVLSFAACGKDDKPTDPTGSVPSSGNNGDNGATEGNGGDNGVVIDSTYNSALELYAEVCYKGCTVEMLTRMAPNAYWAFYESAYGISKDTLLGDGIMFVQEKSNYYKSVYGDNITITIDVQNEEAVPADELESAKQCLKEQKGIDPATVTAAYKLDVNFVLGGDETGEEFQQLVAMQIDGNWYLGGWYIEDGYGYCWFEIDNLMEAG